jgi:hypothetical protein
MQSPFGQKLSITRPQAASQPAFDKHFDELVDVYQAVHCVKLVSPALPLLLLKPT